jgi:hypothetical protein
MTDEFIFDEKAHAYFLNGKPMMGCTTVLGVIAKPALINWAARMAVEYIYANSSLKPEKENNNKIWQVTEHTLEEARTAHAKKRDKAADAGTDLHALVEEYVRDCIATKKGYAISTTGYPDLAPIQAFIDWAIKEKIRFIASEQRLYSKSLWVAGTCDLIFEKDGKRYVGDIKTYKKIWDRVPLIQCAGYALMYEEMQQGTLAQHPEDISDGIPDFSETHGPKIDGYCIICLPKERAFNEAEDVLWSWDTEGDTEAFRAAVKLYTYLKQK